MRLGALLAGFTAMIVLAGCGGGHEQHGGSSSSPGVMTVSGTVPPNVATGTATSLVAGAQTVTVTLNEYTVQLDRTTVPAGPVRFLVVNKGQRGHQFQVYPQSSAPAAGGHDQSMSNTQGGVISGAVGFLALVPPGSTKALDVTLTSGAWELSCHLLDSENGKQFDHYDRGMKTSLNVTS